VLAQIPTVLALSRVWVAQYTGEPGQEEDGFAPQDGKSPRNGTLFGGPRLTIEPGSDFPIGVNPLLGSPDGHFPAAEAVEPVVG
jgi:hypothetical protein